MTTKFLSAVCFATTIGLCAPAVAQSLSFGPDYAARSSSAITYIPIDPDILGPYNRGTSPGSAPTPLPWMSPEVGAAWQLGYRGRGTRLTIIDGFDSNYSSGNIGTGSRNRAHGDWVTGFAAGIAPGANVARFDYYSDDYGLPLARGGLNVLNLSYSVNWRAGVPVSAVPFAALERDVISYAQNGDAVVVKAAGNDGITLTGTDIFRNYDALNAALLGGSSVIFVGELDKNGTPSNQASLKFYSNTPGTSATAQNSFLSVSSGDAFTGLEGTSFAAPIVAGYAAVMGSKFTKATPDQITNQLLTTARTDTILNYDVTKHGRGEASLSRALAPRSIR